MSKPTMDEQEQIDHLRRVFWAAHRDAEKAAYALAGALPVGPERVRAFEVYENIRNAPRTGA